VLQEVLAMKRVIITAAICLGAWLDDGRTLTLDHPFAYADYR
jgi:hypothetical protein